MRETLLGTRELAKKLAALEKKLTGRLHSHEAAIVHASITEGQFVQSLTFGRLLQRKEGQPHPGPIFVLGRFFSYSFLSFFALSDFWELHDVGDRLGSILAEGRLEHQFSVSDLG